jgi:YD repeat-containing protein
MKGSRLFLLVVVGLFILSQHQAKARYYDARVGRFLSVDPASVKYPGWSPYHYTLGNPLRYVDPTGKWSAEYDKKGNIVTARAEKGDKLAGLYKQLGTSSNEFAKKFGIDDMEGAEVVAGKTTFNISDFVFAKNSTVDPSSLAPNCHGFVMAAKGLASGEGTPAQVNTADMTAVGAPKTGDVAEFMMQGSYQFKGQPPVDASSTQGHSAIFVLTNQAGEGQFVNRLNTNQPISISSQSQIVGYLKDVAARNASHFAIPPQVNPNPQYFRVK